MKRHPKLIPISRKHHEVLLLARLIRDDAPPYKGLPVEKNEKVKYAQEKLAQLIQPTFEVTRQVFDYANSLQNETLLKQSESLSQLQSDIISAFQNLTEKSMDTTGKLLEGYVRKTEREFFQQLQEATDLNTKEFSF